jgi:hypothetical protein
MILRQKNAHQHQTETLRDAAMRIRHGISGQGSTGDGWDLPCKTH